MKVGVAGQGAFGVKHLEALAVIPGIEVITLTGGNQVFLALYATGLRNAISVTATANGATVPVAWFGPQGGDHLVPAGSIRPRAVRQNHGYSGFGHLALLLS